MVAMLWLHFRLHGGVMAKIRSQSSLFAAVCGFVLAACACFESQKEWKRVPGFLEVPWQAYLHACVFDLSNLPAGWSETRSRLDPQPPRNLPTFRAVSGEGESNKAETRRRGGY
ncbi:hypothetical protein THAOC_36519 [Thalassiosira oceanica]|uniref:Uncharacterized protein n=1 Tax=Thalassiosira oceanica TaxID=159749 RepID=K0RED8_THAOC|nr:hypothetical protein THAOC_36519 [Thalassiosira oceanica]|eukprot:EJK44907.1 hypothetical protein THAOC_36519 [Thalassiosira oceanica]